MNQPLPFSPQHTAQNPIGVFDSGLGGLRVLDRLMQTLPDERFVYLGDTLHMPYGEKTQAQVTEYLSASLHWLFERHQVKMMVVACNTAASVAPQLFSRYPGVPFVDPVTPICRWLATTRQYRTVGVMATPATVASNRYQILLDDLNAPVLLSQVGCDHLASLIEAGQGETPACHALLRQYLRPLQDRGAEAIVLGCTHYPYVMDQVAALSPNADVLDPAVFMALDAKRLLAEHQLANPQVTGRPIAEVDYFVTAEPDRFYETSRRMPFQALAMKHPTVVSIPALSLPS
ncbi:glutamate racemase [Vampirovibrio chlorellavorus]|uniref:glutamate racemase n=1 Tax=Vampirovibrio chlorellavorus TaxID=758823 RepID=UPI0026F263A6|nr:glutamate racemase [Vampirovibrio chlorellavorus]